MIETSDHLIVTTTIDSEETADVLAEEMVKKRLAACVQKRRIGSIYKWRGAIEKAVEFALDAKTTGGMVEDLCAFIAERHPYDEPEIIVTPIIAGSKTYLQWITDETGV